MTAQGTCYYPDKSIATGFELCNSTLAGPNGAGSACCSAGDICTTGGYCLNSLYYPYRGACTDKSWNSDNCASECLNVAPFRTIPAVPCGDSGNFNGAFCCSLVATTSCCNATFGNVFGKPYAPMTLAATPVNDTNGSSTTVTAQPAIHSGSDATKVGVGVGVPLGILLLLSLVFAAWTERRRRRYMERVARETGWSRGQWGHEKSFAGSDAYGMKHLRHEAEGGDRRIQELGDGELHEAGAGGGL